MLLLTLLSKESIVFCFTKCLKVLIFICNLFLLCLVPARGWRKIHPSLFPFSTGESSSANNVWRPLYMVREGRRGRSILRKLFPTKYFYKYNSSGCGVHHYPFPYRSRENCCLHSNSENQLCHDHRDCIPFLYVHTDIYIQTHVQLAYLQDHS